MGIPWKKPFFTLTYFYEIRMPFPESASKTLSHIQSTPKYILLQALYYILVLVEKMYHPFFVKILQWQCNKSWKKAKTFRGYWAVVLFLEFLWTYRLLSIFCFLFLQHSIRAILRQDPPFGKEEISWVCSSSNGCSTVSKSVEHWMQGFQLLENAVDIFCP